ncbi:MAG: discoidin domain-containing protein, partial [Planctomycetota bacterium]
MIRLTASLFLAAAAWAAPPETRPGENLARGRPYTMGRPNYHHCTDPADKTQLTDGVYTKGYFWTQKTTVGWRGGAPQLITIDLGADRPICGVSWSTAAGVAGVQWPDALMVFVSPDGQRWHEVGDLVQLSAAKASPPKGEYATHVFWTDALATHGRYVQIAAIPRGPYLFVDEIEVFRGDDAFCDKPYPGKGAVDVKALMRRRQLTSLIQAQLRRDLAAVRDDIAAPATPADARQKLTDRADGLQGRIDAMALASPEGFRAVLPMNDLERDIFRLQARVWHTQGKPELRIWQCHRWDPLAPSQEPPPNAAEPTLKVTMMNGETRADVLNLTNAGHTDLRIHLAIEGLPGRAPRPSVGVHEVQCVGTRHFVAVSAALPPAKQGGKGYM